MDKRTVATVTVIGGLIIFGLKLLAFFVSGSIALLSDALESVVNIIAAIMMFISVRISAKPADTEHLYGHEKVENISAVVERALVRELAQFARRKRDQVALVSVPQVIEDIVRLLSHDPRSRNVRIETRLDGSLPGVRARVESAGEFRG